MQARIYALSKYLGLKLHVVITQQELHDCFVVLQNRQMEWCAAHLPFSKQTNKLNKLGKTTEASKLLGFYLHILGRRVHSLWQEVMQLATA